LCLIEMSDLLLSIASRTCVGATTKQSDASVAVAKVIGAMMVESDASV
jgi:hypothetical protein